MASEPLFDEFDAGGEGRRALVVLVWSLCVCWQGAWRWSARCGTRAWRVARDAAPSSFYSPATGVERAVLLGAAGDDELELEGIAHRV